MLTRAKRLGVWLFGLGMLLVFSGAASAETSNSIATDAIVGAIRWDAWVGDDPSLVRDVGEQVETTLGPSQYHDRLPFYADIVGTNEVDINGATQAIVDQEIGYAKSMGLDYWAFVTYRPTVPFEAPIREALNLYLSSTQKSQLNFCVIVGNYYDEATFIDYFQLPEYQTVLNGRPLIYFYQSLNNFDIQSLRDAAAAAGLPDPYIVAMAGGSGGDAVSAYNTWMFNSGGPYSYLAGQDRSKWSSNASHPYIPIVTTGLDTRPRYDNPVSWMTVSSNMWVQQATPKEIGDHLQEAVDWVGTNPSSAESKAVLMYAWNEFDEGGWIAPTYYGGYDRGAAVEGVLRDFRLTAVPADDGIHLSWRSMPGASSSELKRSTTSGGPYTVLQTGAGASYVDTGVATGITYYYAVTAKNGSTVIGESGEKPSSLYGRNLALSRTYSSSSQADASQSAAKAFDGSLSTNWQSSAGASYNGTWLEVNFGTNVTFDKAMLSEYNGRTSGFRLEYWNGSAWQTAYTGTTIGSKAAPSQLSFPAVTGSKVRIYYTAGTYTPVLYEFGLYRTPDNLALNRSYSGSSQADASQSAAKAFDGSPLTNWQAAAGSAYNAQWLEVNFGANVTFDRVVLSEYGGRTSGFRIEYWNGSAWQTAYTGTAIGGRSAPSEFAFTAVTGSKARIAYTSGSVTPIVYEFAVYKY